MRLPHPDELTSAHEQQLHANDVVEYHATDPKSFLRLGYLRRLEVMRDLVDRLGPTLRILDVGCAQGNLALLLAEAGHHVVAADLRSEFLHYVRKKHEHGRLDLVALNAERLPFEPVFDLVVLGELLEHAAHPDSLLAEAARVLKPTGAVLVTTPNERFLLNRLPSLSEVTADAQLEARQFKPDGDGHLFLLRPRELVDLVKQAGLHPEVVRLFNSPFATGAAKWRHIGRWLPLCLSKALEVLTSRCPLLNRKLCAGLAVLARRSEKA